MVLVRRLSQPNIKIEHDLDRKLVAGTRSEDFALKRKQYQRLPMPAPRRKRRQRLHVQFDLSQNVEHKNESVSKEEVKILWYRKKDYAEFRDQVVRNAKRTRKMKRADSTNPPVPYHHVMRCAYRTCFVPSLTASNLSSVIDLKALRALTDGGTDDSIESSLGMDPWILSSYGKERIVRRKSQSKLLLTLQEARTSSDCIRSECEKISHPARVFARLLAEAIL